ncbi:hypothetical protein DYU11_03780 [Fibrisoma montanum]|uniref:Uncharacterized protein n=1 Tax=Fibrisoma montanum TaxID=2305895 RepID=A0A418MJ67_9BACT|nr:hypothetical protein [Fibrisoma montanum]RIV27436.1 hypothetical protein DYU11_03780 [Fibrisoma montanum]
MNRFGLLSLFLVFVGLSCNPERVQYTKELKQEMADMKIKRVTNADLVSTVDNLGAKITAVAQRELADQLAKTTDPARQAAFCALQNLPKTQAIAKNYGLTIQLLGEADVQNKALSPKEREVLDAYLYNAEQNLPQISNIQKINDTLFIYNNPIPESNPICQTCFGNQKEKLAVWRLAFSKREVIRRINSKKKT